ncbi:hypothetical protein HWV62_39752 [Athelia sp. TMB]|nr:hypothetical protein HWV62_39752 [Athelia sp. TMB]
MATLNGRSALRRAATQSEGEIWSAGTQPGAMAGTTQTTSCVGPAGQVPQHRPGINVDISKASSIDPIPIRFEFDKTRRERDSGSSSSLGRYSYGGNVV